MNITLNPEQRLYVIQNEGYVSCHGFGNVKADVNAMATCIGIDPTSAAEGSIEMYKVYQDLLARFSNHPASKKTWFTPGTDPKVAKVLDTAYKNEQLVRIFLGNSITGHDWAEENDIVGFIGRSSGTFKVPLLLEAYQTSSKTFESSRHGGAILTNCVIRVIDVLSQKELYRHPMYQSPEFKVVGTTPDLLKLGYRFGVDRIGAPEVGQTRVANFKTEDEAHAYVAFMKGHRLAQPLRTRAQAEADIEFN